MLTQNERASSERSASPPKRRWFRLGPGLLLAIIASVLLWRQLPPRTGGSTELPPPRIERKRVDIEPVVPLSAPDPTWLLSQHEALGLSTAQVQKLRQLELRWSRDTRELQDALARVSGDFNRDMAATGSSKGVTLEALRQQAAPVSALSRQLAAARRAWWSEASSVLTPVQQKQVQARWQERLLAPPPQR